MRKKYIHRITLIKKPVNLMPCGLQGRQSECKWHMARAVATSIRGRASGLDCRYELPKPPAMGALIAMC